MERNCCKQDFVYQVVDSCVVFVPNIFTPDGDGKNDQFGVRGQQIASVNIKVYNKKNQQIFEGVKQGEYWNGVQWGGKWDSKKIEGHYKFVMDAVSTSGKNIHGEGDVCLLMDPSKYCLKHIGNCVFNEQFQNGMYSALNPSGEETLFKKCK